MMTQPPYKGDQQDKSRDPSDELLDRFVAGECSAAEAETTRRWIVADPSPPSRQEKVARLRAIWETTRRPSEAAFESWNVDAAWRSAAARMGVSSEEKPTARVIALEPKRRIGRSWIARAQTPALRAASVVLIVGSAAVALYVASGRFSSADRPVVAGVVSVKEYATQRGQRATIGLVDGTRVILGPESRLRVPGDYGRATGDTSAFTSRSSAGARTVTLDGEGYFDVAHDASRPFAVRAGSALVRDIGTTFVVRASQSGRAVDVAVTDGVVLLAETRLERGDLGRLDTAGAVSVKRGVDLRPYTSWTTGRLVFDDTPLAEAVPMLERWYDVKIEVADRALYRRRLFATVNERDPASQVVDLIALSLDLRVERNGRHVTLRSRGTTR